VDKLTILDQHPRIRHLGHGHVGAEGGAQQAEGQVASSRQWCEDELVLKLRCERGISLLDCLWDLERELGGRSGLQMCDALIIPDAVVPRG
jgi:hypothetical protein